MRYCSSTRACSLRAAIQEANALAGADEIILPPNTYVLTNVSLDITSSLTITGSRASTTIIDGNKSVRPDSRVLLISFGITVNISGVTIRNGGTGGGGGGIFNVGTLTLTNSTVSGNNGFFGGGIFNDINGTMTLTNSTVSGNVGGNGGGIHNDGTLTLINSTVSGNRADGAGGGIFNAGTANLFNSTIAENRADADSNGSGIGGGVFNQSGATFNFQNTILAGNFETAVIFGGIWVPFVSDCAGSITSNGNNLMQNVDTSQCTVNGSAPILADPKLGPLQNNGGPTLTHALLTGGPAIDAGNPSGCKDSQALLLKDQRGLRRTVDGNRDGTARCDIGAVEFGSGPGFTSDVDFDGDGRNDIGVYRDGTWFIHRSSDGGMTSAGWGGAQDIPVPADYDGDGKADLAVYRNGDWFIHRSSDGGMTTVGWGGAQDIPLN